MIRIETELFISAPPQKVWDVLMDFANYPQWNPLIVSMSGNQNIGGKLKTLTENPDGMGRMIESLPKVTINVEKQMFAWKDRMFIPWVFDTVHYYRLQAAGKGTLFTHGESYSGILANKMRQTILKKYPAAFDEMNKALAKRIEELEV